MYRILVVEDESLLAVTLSYALEDAGYQVVLAADGRDGLELALTMPPDLIITDFMMPRMNGIAMVERLRIAGVTVPVIMLTAVPEENLARQDLYDMFVRKPYDEQKLLGTVQELIATTALK